MKYILLFYSINVLATQHFTVNEQSKVREYLVKGIIEKIEVESDSVIGARTLLYIKNKVIYVPGGKLKNQNFEIADIPEFKKNQHVRIIYQSVNNKNWFIRKLDKKNINYKKIITSVSESEDKLPINNKKVTKDKAYNKYITLVILLLLGIIFFIYRKKK